MGVVYINRMSLQADSSMNEAELVERARHSDQEAWIALVRAHQEPVFRFAYLILGNRQDAEDAAQEVMIRAYRALERFDTSRPLRPWLLAIAGNTARNRLRSIGRYLNAIGRLFQQEPDPKITRNESGIGEADLDRLWEATRRLKETDRNVIYLRFYMELSVEETAQALDVPEGTVKSRLHRALPRLRELIENEYPELMEA